MRWRIVLLGLAATIVLAAAPAVASGNYVYQRDVLSSASARFGPGGVQNPATYRPLAGARRVFQIERAITEERWLGADGTDGRLAVLLGQRGPAKPSSPWDAAAWVDAGSPKLATLLPWTGSIRRLRDLGPDGSRGYFLGGGSLSAVLPVTHPLSVVPRSAAALDAWLRKQACWHVIETRDPEDCPRMPTSSPRGTESAIESSRLASAMSILRFPYAPRTLRATLISVLASTPGAETLRGVRDPRGRRVTVIVLARSQGVRQAIATSLSSFKVLAFGQAADGVNLAAVRWHDVYDVAVGRVARIGDRPR